MFELLGFMLLGPATTAAAAVAPDAKTTAAPTSVRPADTGDKGSLGDLHAIALADTESMRVAAIEHLGPFWAVGAAYERVRAEMYARGEEGPLVIRHLDDPLTTPPQKLRNEVGFVLRGGAEPAAPFVVSEWPPEFVARMTVPGLSRFSSGYYHGLRRWVLQRDLAPAGPVIELLYFPSEGASDQPVGIQILMAVCEPDRPTAAEDEASVQAEPPTTSNNVRGPETASVKSPAASDGLESAVAGERAHRADVGDAAPAEGSSSESAHNPNSDVAPAAIHHGAAIRDLIDARRFDDLAGQLLPNDLPASDPTRSWLREIVLRVSALARGVRKQFPDREGWLTPLAEALVRREEALKAPARGEGQLERRMVRELPAREVGQEQRKAVTRRLDLLMARVGVRSIELSDAENELVGVLQDAQNLLDVARR